MKSGFTQNFHRIVIYLRTLLLEILELSEDVILTKTLVIYRWLDFLKTNSQNCYRQLIVM